MIKLDTKFKYQTRVLKPQLERPSRSELLLLPFCVRTTRGNRGIHTLFPPWDVCGSRMRKSVDNPLIYSAQGACVNIGDAMLVPDC